MDTDTTFPVRKNASDEAADALPDPFAADLFVGGRAASSSTPVASSQPTSRETPAQTGHAAHTLWHTRLPLLPREQLRLSTALAVLPPSLTGDARARLARVIGRYSNTAPDQVEVAAVDIHETGWPSHRRGVLTADDAAPRAWVVLSAEPGSLSASIVAELDARFVAALVDHMLGGDGTPPEALRTLSRAEQAVVEFLWLAIVRELNESAGAAVWRVENVSTHADAVFAAAKASDDLKLNDTEASLSRRGERFIVVTVRLRIASLDGTCRLYLNRGALRALDASGNPLFAKKRRRDAARLAELKRFAPDVALHVHIGDAEASAADLALLKRGDVVIVSRTVSGLNAGGRVEVSAGEGRALLMSGRVEGDAAQDDDEMREARTVETGGVRIMIETISNGEASVASERVAMDDDEKLNDEDNEGGVALDQLLLSIHVELPARRISLDELTRLRAGQFLELGCRPTDPVELVADGRRIARGELIDFEGQLGVRITEVNG